MSVLDKSVHAVTATTHLRSQRSWWLLVSLALCVLALARHVVPNAQGFGTHTQLGMPACAFLTWTGLPCPACGLTTCFAHMARGQLQAALHANAVGVLLFALVLASLPISVWAIARKHACFEIWTRMHIARVSLTLACALLLQWVTRVACLLLR
jgi:hypothetical protein